MIVFNALDMWRDAEKRKNFFEEYAKRHGIDSRDPEQWYSVPRDSFMAVKVLLFLLYFKHFYSFS